MTTIIVENGNGVPNANSYVDQGELEKFFEMFNIEIPPLETLGELAARSCMFIDMQTACWPGCRSLEWQNLVWPRTGVYENNCASEPIPPKDIPKSIKRAQLFAAVAAAQGINLFPSYDPTAGTGEVKREEIGPLKTEYFGANPALFGVPTKLPAVSNLLEPFLSQSCSGGQFRTMRV